MKEEEKNTIKGEMVGATVGALLGLKNPALAFVGDVVSPLVAHLYTWIHNEKYMYSQRQLINIGNILQKVELNKNDSNVLNDEWIALYLDNVKNISDENMQEIWSKILSGEINKPGTFSKRTLDTINKISKNEAMLFQEVQPYIFRGEDNLRYIPKFGFLENYGINTSKILLLKDMGLVAQDNELDLTETIESTKSLFLGTTNKIISVVNISKEELKFTMHAYAITVAGQELLTVLKSNENNEFLINVAKEIKNTYKDKAKIMIYDKLADGRVLNTKNIQEIL